MIQPDLPDAVCLDLFAGTGALGIEALSRGAARVYFCDNSSLPLAALRQNLAACRIEERRAVILADDWRVAIKRVREKCHLVLIDAPYEMCEYYSQILEMLRVCHALEFEALIVIERDVETGGYELPEGFKMAREKRYGSTGVDLLIYAESGGGNDL